MLSTYMSCKTIPETSLRSGPRGLPLASLSTPASQGTTLCKGTLLCGTGTGISDTASGGLPGTGPLLDPDPSAQQVRVPTMVCPTFPAVGVVLWPPEGAQMLQTRNTRWLEGPGDEGGFSHLSDGYLHSTATLHTPANPFQADLLAGGPALLVFYILAPV